MRKLIYISVLLLSFSSGLHAQKKFVYEDTSLLQKEEEVGAPLDDYETQIPVTADRDTPDTVLTRNTLHLPADSLKGWQKLKAYGYMKTIDSVLKAEGRAEEKKRRTPSAPGFLESFLASGVLSLVLWSLAVLFVGFIIYRLFLAEGVFLRKPKAVENTGAEIAVEEINRDSDFEAIISQALQNNNYRQAVRYQYLRTLHTLALKQFIELAPDKTNYQYVREISNPGHRQDFAALTLHYEYVWYGEFNIEAGIYRKIEQAFNNLNQKL